MISLALSLSEAGEFFRARSLLENAATAMKRFLPHNHATVVNSKFEMFLFYLSVYTVTISGG